MMVPDVFSSWGGEGMHQPIPVDQSSGSREVTPRSGDEGGGGPRRGDDRQDGEDGPSSSGNKRKARLMNNVTVNDDDASRGPYPHGITPFDGGNAGMIANGVDSLRRRIAARLLNHEEIGCRCSPLLLLPGINDRVDDDTSSSSSTWIFAMADGGCRRKGCAGLVVVDGTS